MSIFNSYVSLPEGILQFIKDSYGKIKITMAHLVWWFRELKMGGSFHFCKVNDKTFPEGGSQQWRCAPPPKKNRGFHHETWISNCDFWDATVPTVLRQEIYVDLLGDDSLIYGDFPWRSCMLNLLFSFLGVGNVGFLDVKDKRTPRFTFRSRRRSEGKLRSSQPGSCFKGFILFYPLMIFEADYFWVIFGKP